MHALRRLEEQARKLRFQVNFSVSLGGIMKFSALSTIAVLCLAGFTSAAASSFPTKPIRLVVPFPAGGGTDALARVFGHHLTLALNQQVLIDNRGGASGILGSGIVSRATPDGYTLLLGTSSTHGSNPSLFTKLPYDPVVDFSPISLLAVVPQLLVIHPSVNAQTVNDLIALAKKNPGQLNGASIGLGSSQHLTLEIFKSRANIDIVHVPYKGTAPAYQDLISGRVQLIFTNPISAIPHLKANRLRALAVTTPKRASILPDIPTVAESLPGFSATQWYGFLAPAKTPRSVIKRINHEIDVILAKPEVIKQLGMDGAEPGGGAPEHFANHIKTEIRKFAQAAEVAKIPKQ